ncbi:unnamed protein product [marine sediment metagenome]|uniref:Uncharacterized protein n=1 Tax=marine sediment metagenome TaxID=412755 RepID=X0XVH8_9ZZZZ
MGDVIHFVEPSEKEMAEHMEKVNHAVDICGSTLYGYCQEHGHVFLAMDLWPPQMKCLVCGERERRPEPEPLGPVSGR